MVGKPKCVRILAMTAGSSMVAMSVTGPPQWEQEVMSIAKTRLSNWAQLRRVRVEVEGVTSSSSAGADLWSDAPGTI